MFKRIVVLAIIVSLGSVIIRAQVPDEPAPTRIRITGASAYEIPGVLKVDAKQVRGRPVSTDALTMRATTAGSGVTLVVLRAGVRMMGRAIDVEDDVLAFLPDGQADVLAIPLVSIGTLEVSQHRGKRRPVLGTLVGLGAFYGTVALIFWGGCGLRCSNAMVVPAIASGVAAGSLVGRRRETWKMMPLAWLTAQFSGQAGGL